MSWRVPSAAPLIDDDAVEAVAAVLRRGVLANGPEAAALEEEFAAYCGAPHAVAVSSGTAALVLAGQALGLVAGDTVAVPAFTFAASANAFLSLGCRVVPVDVDGTTMNLDGEVLAAAIDRWSPRVVVVVDLYGGTAGTDAAIAVAREAGLLVIEDAAQAHGARTTGGGRVGSRADATAFSLYATKNMAAGEGGLVTVAEPALDGALRRLRSHGAAEQYHHEQLGLNHRIPEMEAALARRQLLRLDERNDLRRERAGRVAGWCRAAWGDRVQVPPEAGAGGGRDAAHVFHQLTVRFTDPTERDRVAEALRADGVDARHFYPYTIGELPSVEPAPTPTATRLRDTVLSLPVHPGLDDHQLAYLEKAIRRAAR